MTRLTLDFAPLPEFGKTGKTMASRRKQLETFIREQWNLRLHQLRGIFVDIHPDGSYHEVSLRQIKRMAADNGLPSSREILLDTLIDNEEKFPVFNPFAHYLKGLPEWDKTDHIAKLADSVLFFTPEDSNRFARHLKKHFLRTVACGLGEMINKHAILLISTPHMGKSSFIQFTIPPQLTEYATILKADEKISDNLIANYLFVNIEEMKGFSPVQHEVNKAMMSASGAVVKVWERVSHSAPRITTFWATSNHLDLIKDPADVRFLPFRVRGFRYSEEENYTQTIDIHQVYAQALYLYKKSKQTGNTINQALELTPEEVKENKAAANLFRKYTEAMHWVQEYMEPADEEQYMGSFGDVKFLRPLEIRNLLAKKPNFKSDKDKLSPEKIGSALTAMGFVKAQINRKELGGRKVGYWVRLLQPETVEPASTQSASAL